MDGVFEEAGGHQEGSWGPQDEAAKTVANPPYFSNSVDARCTLGGETKRRIHRAPSDFRPPDLDTA